MRSGIEWHDSNRPLDETDATPQLGRSDDWIGFPLRQPMDAELGTRWATTAAAASSRSLFAPLGIRDHRGKRTPAGHPDTEGGLYLGARDLARIGQRYPNDGVCRGQRLLPPGWAREATSRHVASTTGAPNAPGSGCQWWRYDRLGAEVCTGDGFRERVPGVRGPLLGALRGA